MFLWLVFDFKAINRSSRSLSPLRDYCFVQDPMDLFLLLLWRQFISLYDFGSSNFAPVKPIVCLEESIYCWIFTVLVRTKFLLNVYVFSGIWKLLFTSSRTCSWCFQSKSFFFLCIFLRCKLVGYMFQTFGPTGWNIVQSSCWNVWDCKSDELDDDSGASWRFESQVKVEFLNPHEEIMQKQSSRSRISRNESLGTRLRQKEQRECWVQNSRRLFPMDDAEKNLTRSYVRCDEMNEKY